MIFLNTPPPLQRIEPLQIQGKHKWKKKKNNTPSKKNSQQPPQKHPSPLFPRSFSLSSCQLHNRWLKTEQG